MPDIRLMVCRMGIGLTAPSRFLVRKSQNILGQKKPSIAAATWSVDTELELWCEIWEEKGHTDCSSENDEAGPMILNEFTHFV